MTLNLSTTPNPREIYNAITALLSGKSNNTGSFTLAASATSTVVKDRLCGPDSVILPMPKTANAGAAVISHTETTRGQFTIHHDSDSSTDRTFSYICVG